MKVLNLCTLAGFPPFFFEEMEKRYAIFEKELVRNIGEYHFPKIAI